VAAVLQTGRGACWLDSEDDHVIDQAMTVVLTVAVIVSTLLTVVVLLRYGRSRVEGRIPLRAAPFVAVLFCSGLDVGLIMFPLTEYPVYESEAAYSFAHPLSIELGMWGLLIWGFYFLTAFYFLRIEPRLQLFKIRWVNLLNSLIIMATCAFTGYIFLAALPTYIPGLPGWAALVVVAAVVAFACYSASDVIFMKWLSIGSMVGLGGLGLAMFAYAGGDLVKYGETLTHFGGYFANLHRFLVPFSDYHEFYLFWWFSWSIMIGQFMAKFASEMSVRRLAGLMIVVPSIPLALWFAVLYIYHSDAVVIPIWLNLAMVTLGALFVVNSLDSLIRLYTDNLSLTVVRLGKWPFIGLNFLIMAALVGAYALLGFKIEHVGLTVILLYAVVYTFMLRQRRDVLDQLRGGGTAGVAPASSG
jgi:choline-glycine betaine transporter